MRDFGNMLLEHKGTKMKSKGKETFSPWTKIGGSVVGQIKQDRSIANEIEKRTGAAATDREIERYKKNMKGK